jgi:DNA-binding response OmpR family regulator
MSQKETEKLESWLTARGLRANPFQRWSADHDQDLPRYFVDMGGFDEVLRARGPCIVFAQRGCGKTAQRQMLAAQCQPGSPSSDLLAIPYTYSSFGPLLERANEDLDDVGTMDHVAALLAKAIRIVSRVEHGRQSSSQGTPTAAGVSKELAELERRLAPYLPHATGEVATSIRGLGALEAIQRFGELVHELGIETCVVLVDGIDESPKTAGRPAETAAFLAPLLGTPPLLECLRWSFRFYLPLELRPVLYDCPWFHADRLESVSTLSWDENSLGELLRQRLLHYSVRQPPLEDLAQLCEDDLAPLVDRELVLLAHSLPRAALRLADALLRSHASQGSVPERIELHTWERVKRSWRERRADFALGVPTPKPSNLDAQSTITSATELTQPQLLHLDLDKGLVWLGRHEIRKEIKPQDYAVLACLWEHRDGVSSKDLIAREAWPADASEGVSDQAIAAAIARLRRVLERHAAEWEYIETVRSRKREQGGYRLYPKGQRKGKARSHAETAG